MRQFKVFKRNVLVGKRAKAFLRFKELRRSRYLKLLTFLYIKQEGVIGRHLYQLQ